MIDAVGKGKADGPALVPPAHVPPPPASPPLLTTPS